MKISLDTAKHWTLYFSKPSFINSFALLFYSCLILSQSLVQTKGFLNEMPNKKINENRIDFLFETQQEVKFDSENFEEIFVKNFTESKIKKNIFGKKASETPEEIIELSTKGNDFEPSEDCLKSYISENKTIKDLTQNKKFVLGKCNPILLVPGFLGVRLRAVVDCPNLKKDKDIFSELRFFCSSKSICKESFFSSYEVEEYTLWPSLFNSPFKLLQDSSNPDNSCMAYFMRIFNNENECPQLNANNIEDASNNKEARKPICFHNKYINISFFGDSEKTKDQLDCGLKPISRMVDPGFGILPEKFTNTPSTEGFYDMGKFLVNKGYSEGFSLAGLPYDFRLFGREGSDFEEKFFNLLEMLNRNTGKKVILVSHSLGNIFTNNILSNKKYEKKLKALVARNIALVPPYIGTAKDMELFISGTEEFKKDLFAGYKLNVSFEAQKFFGSFNPNFYLLFLKPFLNTLKEQKKYLELYDAIVERAILERKCRNLIKPSNNDTNKDNLNKEDECTDNFIEKNSAKFSKLFPFIPKLNSPQCKNLYSMANELKKNSNFEEIKKTKRSDIYENLPTYEACFLRIFDYFNCPFVMAKDESDKEIRADEFEKLCLNDYPGKNITNPNGKKFKINIIIFELM